MLNRVFMQLTEMILEESVDDTESNKILNAELQSGDEEIEAEYSTSTIVTFPIKFDSLPNAQSMNPSNPDQIIVHAFNDDQLVSPNRM